MIGLAAWAAVLAAPSVVAAEQPGPVVTETEDDGVYVASALAGAYDEAAWAATVAAAREQGVDLRVVAPLEPVPSLEAFALRILQAADADVVVAFDADGNLASAATEELTTARYRGDQAARDLTDPSAALDAYLTAFVSEPTRELPGLVRRLAVIVVVLVLVIGAATFVELSLRQRRTRRRTAEISADQGSGTTA